MSTSLGRLFHSPALLIPLLVVSLMGCGPQRAPETHPDPVDPADDGGGGDDVASHVDETDQLTRRPEHWTGTIALPGVELGFTASLYPTEDGYRGELDIPMQGAVDLPLDNIVVEGETRSFDLPSVDASWTFQIADVGTTGTGTFTQRGQEFPFVVEKTEEPEEAAQRPQRPQPPFPYQEEEVQFTNQADGTVLAGTLTLPEGEGPFPAVVLVTGSGTQDRDETIFGHKPFLVLADHLTREGIAVLRYDDRGIGGSKATRLNVDTLDLAGDAAAGVDFLLSRDDVDPEHVGIIGHSEGGIIAPILASQRDDLAFIVMLAGTGVPGREILAEQLRAMYEAYDVPEEEIEPVIQAYQTAIPTLADPDADKETRIEAARPLVEAQVELATRYLGEDANVDSELGIAVEMMHQKWMQTFVTLDPRDYLKKVTIPVLALNGTLDMQVRAEQNLPEIEKALAEAGNQQVVILRLDRLNHLFQTAESGLPSEYGSIEETFSPTALDIISTWIKEQSK